MAKKRMFSLDVVETDDFLDMPASAQALYFHLGMHGDDDGFVASPKKIQRGCGSRPSDLKLLRDKGYIISFDSGVIVLRDWLLNNELKNDRYRATIYCDEKYRLCLDDSKRYMPLSQLEPSRLQNGSISEPQHNVT